MAGDTVAGLKVRQVIRLINDEGWYQVAQKGSHRQFKHSTKPGLVTVPGKPGDDLGIGNGKMFKPCFLPYRPIWGMSI